MGRRRSRMTPARRPRRWSRSRWIAAGEEGPLQRGRRDRRVATGVHPPVRRRAGAQPARLGPAAARALGRHHPGDHRQRRRPSSPRSPSTGGCSAVGSSLHPPALRAFRWRVLRFALLLTLLVTPVLAAAYAAGSADRTEFLALVGTVAVTPILAALASMLSGECVARGAPVVPVAVHSMRSLVPAVLLLAWPNAPLWLIALGTAGRGGDPRRHPGWSSRRRLRAGAGATGVRGRPGGPRPRRAGHFAGRDAARAGRGPAVPVGVRRRLHLQLRDRRTG